MAVTADMVAERGKNFFPVVHGTTYYARRRPAGCFFSEGLGGAPLLRRRGGIG
jgi:hypothetical protein